MPPAGSLNCCNKPLLEHKGWVAALRLRNVAFFIRFSLRDVYDAQQLTI